MYERQTNYLKWREKYARITLDLPVDVYKGLRIFAVEHRTTVRAIIEELVRNKLGMEQANAYATPSPATDQENKNV